MSCPVNPRLLVLIAWLLVAVGRVLIPQHASTDDNDRELAERARALLTQRCFQCHGANGVARKNLFVLDRNRLISSKFVIPGDVNSLLVRVTESGAMPMGGPELPAEEKAVLKSWVLKGAPDWGSSDKPTAEQLFLTEASILAFIRDDIIKSPERARPFLRYLSLAHLYNAGAKEGDLGAYRAALSKLINSLSRHREITPPAAIDPNRTLFRIDLRDYNWTAATWDLILAAYPYGIRSLDAEIITRLSGTETPYVRADWFVANASVPPLYHDLLGLPRSIQELERLSGVDTARNLAEEKNVVRAGVRTSGVSQNNRVLERHVSPHGAYWKSFDFRNNLDDQNIFKDPLRLSPAGGEVIFNLPNGLQGYFLADALGRRIDAAPIEIVFDRNNPDDPVIENGRSCMGCHYEGIKPFKDDVRAVVKGMTTGSFERDKALALYAPQETLDLLIEKDRSRFQQAMEQTGGHATSVQTEPINALSRRFFAELSAAQAAAEAGMKPEEFQARVRSSAHLISLGFGQLLVADGGFKRDAWEKSFGELVGELRLGDHIASRGTFLPSGRLGSTGANTWRAERAPARAGLLGSDPQTIMRAARSIFIRSKSMFLKPEVLENELRKRPEFASLGLLIVKDERVADIRIELNRPPFTFIYAFTATNPETSILLANGKVTAWDGSFAAPKIAKEFLKRIQEARSSR